MKHTTAKLVVLGAAIVGLTAAGHGGWLVTTVEDLPEHLVAGRPADISFTLRQHGMSLMNDRAPSVTVGVGKGMQTIAARRTGNGIYTARVIAPAAGEADITINPNFTGQVTKLLPIRVVAANAPAPAPLATAVRGQHLFMAKGCAACHVHNAVKNSGDMDVGPDLTGKRFAVDYLRQFLADPSIKPPTDPNKRMPDLDLKPAEINALVSFINEAKVATK